MKPSDMSGQKTWYIFPEMIRTVKTITQITFVTVTSNEYHDFLKSPAIQFFVNSSDARVIILDYLVYNIPADTEAA